MDNLIFLLLGLQQLEIFINIANRNIFLFESEIAFKAMGKDELIWYDAKPANV